MISKCLQILAHYVEQFFPTVGQNNFGNKIPIFVIHIILLIILSLGSYITNSNGSSALALAALYGHSEIVEYLLNQGSNVNSRDKGNRTPLHYAVLGNQIEISRLLISKGAKVDAIGEIRDQNQSTSLHLAVQLGDCEVSGKINHRPVQLLRHI